MDDAISELAVFPHIGQIRFKDSEQREHRSFYFYKFKYIIEYVVDEPKRIVLIYRVRSTKTRENNLELNEIYVREGKKPLPAVDSV